MFDGAIIERIHPEYWRNSQFSIARFSGGCKINGFNYILDRDTDYLVREDIHKAELKNSAKRKAVDAAEKKYWNEAQQAGLFI